MIKNLLKIKLENLILLTNLIIFISILVYKSNNIIYSEIDLIRINWCLLGLPILTFMSYQGIKEIRNELKKNF